MVEQTSRTTLNKRDQYVPIAEIVSLNTNPSETPRYKYKARIKINHNKNVNNDTYLFSNVWRTFLDLLCKYLKQVLSCDHLNNYRTRKQRVSIHQRNYTSTVHQGTKNKTNYFSIMLIVTKVLINTTNPRTKNAKLYSSSEMPIYFGYLETKSS